MRHCRSVANLAIEIADRKALETDRNEIEEAAMLHDLGIFLTDAPGIECHGSEPYILHGVIGARLLRENGMPERDARVAERHTGAGIDKNEIIAQGFRFHPTATLCRPHSSNDSSAMQINFIRKVAI